MKGGLVIMKRYRANIIPTLQGPIVNVAGINYSPEEFYREIEEDSSLVVLGCNIAVPVSRVGMNAYREC